MKKIFLLSAVFSLLFVSCSEDNENAGFGPNTTIVGFTKSFTNNYLTDDLTADLSVPVTLISYANETFPGDVTVEYSIDPSSTAVEGVEYDLVSTTGSVVLPSGTASVGIPFIVHPDALDPVAPVTIVINMTTVSDNATIGLQYKQVTVTLQGVCNSQLQGTYARGTKISEVTKIGDGLYRATYLPTFASTYWFEFSDVCGVLKITNWQFMDGNPLTGTTTPLPFGYVDGAGNLTFEHVNVAGVPWYVDLTWTLTKQ